MLLFCFILMKMMYNYTCICQIQLNLTVRKEENMKPVLFSIGSLNINGYGLMIALGLLIAESLAERKARKLHIPTEPIMSMVFAAIFSGLLGAKILYWATILDQVIANPSIMLDFGNGFVVYGSIIGAIIGVTLYCRIKKIDLLTYLDLTIPYAALTQAFGRIGCFLAGCCYGFECHSWYAVTFTESTLAPNNVPLFPSQLVYSAANLLHFIVLLYCYKKVKHKGQVFSLYLIFYSIGRYLLEYVRGDLIRGSVGVFSTSQFISLFILLIGVFGFLYSAKMDQKKDSKED